MVTGWSKLSSSVCSSISALTSNTTLAALEKPLGFPMLPSAVVLLRDLICITTFPAALVKLEGEVTSSVLPLCASETVCSELVGTAVEIFEEGVELPAQPSVVKLCAVEVERFP